MESDYLNLMKFTSLLDHFSKITWTILGYAKVSDITEISTQVKNRERLYNIITYLHQSIRNSLEFSSEPLKIDLLNCFRKDLDKFNQQINKIDKSSLDYLNAEINKSKSELKNLNKQKKLIFSYNQNQVKNF